MYTFLLDVSKHCYVEAEGKWRVIVRGMRCNYIGSYQEKVIHSSALLQKLRLYIWPLVLLALLNCFAIRRDYAIT